MDADKIDYDWRSRLARREHVLALRRLGASVFVCDWCSEVTDADAVWIQVYCDNGTFGPGHHCSLGCAVEYAKSESESASIATFISSSGYRLGTGAFTKKWHFLLALSANGDHIWIKERVRHLQESGELA